MDPITHLIPLRELFIFHLFYRGRFNYELAVEIQERQFVNAS